MIAYARRKSSTRREPFASRWIPYAAHVSDGIVTTDAGDYVQTLRLAGASFESTVTLGCISFT